MCVSDRPTVPKILPPILTFLCQKNIIDNNGKIMQEFILHKLKNKSNWISEFSILKKA